MGVDKNYILVLDEGTTGLRAIIVDKKMRMINKVYKELNVCYPSSGEVREDANEIWDKMIQCVHEVLELSGVGIMEIAAIGITTQRATWGLWNKVNGEPIEKFIVWQDSIANARKEELLTRDSEFEKKFPLFVKKIINGVTPTPLRLEILEENNPRYKDLLNSGNALFGGIPAWLPMDRFLMMPL